VLAFWHGQQFALHRWRRRRKTSVLVSLSDDGELQAAALGRVGLVARGSSSRRGASGLEVIVRSVPTLARHIDEARARALGALRVP
jgi:lysophospholipid acyltransferase (LPLAT)-like uncharacterized protein